MLFLLGHGDQGVFGAFSGWTFLLRSGQQLLAIAPQLLTGVLLAGVLGTRGGQAWLRGGLAGTQVGSMLRAGLLGLLTPVGALGALPIATEMLRAGVHARVALSFLVTTPLLMPWSLGYAADQLGPLNAGLLVVGSLLVAVLVGFSLSRTRTVVVPGSSASDSSLLTTLRIAAQHSAGPLLLYVAVAVVGSTLFASILQPGSIEAHLGESSPVTLLELSVPLSLANLDADTAAAFASEFWRIGLLTGGMFVAFYLGAGWGLGTLAWLVHRLGWSGAKVGLTWVSAALVVALIANAALLPERPGEPDSHAFDMLTKPYNYGGSSITDGIAGQLRQAAAGRELGGLAFLALLVTGAVTRSRKAQTPPDQQPEPLATTGRSLTLVLLVGLLVFGVANVYSYYPAQADLEDRLRLHSGNLFEAAVVIESDRSSDEERDVARGLALNAIDGITDTLHRFKIASTIRLATPAPGRVADDYAGSLGEIRRLLQEGASQQLKGAALDLAEKLQGKT